MRTFKIANRLCGITLIIIVCAQLSWCLYTATPGSGLVLKQQVPFDSGTGVIRIEQQYYDIVEPYTTRLYYIDPKGDTWIAQLDFGDKRWVGNCRLVIDNEAGVCSVLRDDSLYSVIDLRKRTAIGVNGVYAKMERNVPGGTLPD